MSLRDTFAFLSAINKSKSVQPGPLFSYSEQEFDKWLNYVSEEQNNRINSLCEKEIEDLNKCELEELYNYKNDKTMAYISKNYDNDNTTIDDRVKFKKYATQSNLEKLIRRKLTDKEYSIARKKFTDIADLFDNNDLSYYDLREYINNEKDNFDDLSMIDTYVLRLVSKFFNNLTNKKIEEEILIQVRAIESAEKRYEYNKR